MSICSNSVSIGVLDGVMYAVGGYSTLKDYSSVEAYTSTDGVWTTIADMHLSRYEPGNYNNYLSKRVILQMI
jgi:kelch-like protein 2/3